MLVINARNVNEAWARAIALVQDDTLCATEGSRDGEARVCTMPVTTMYAKPVERVLLDPVRDANPFFHLFEALWMLAGRDDAPWLDQFVSGFSARFAEEGGRMHGAYGRRWRSWFHDYGDGPNGYRHLGKDQLNEVVRLLRANPRDRQAVIQMWDPSADLGVPNLKDRPCNQSILLRVRNTGRGSPSSELPEQVLDITVPCRSNDMVMGCYGANVVHMSVLQEYLAARIGVGVGVYYQVSNNWHRYERDAAKCDLGIAVQNARTPYPGTYPLVTQPDAFEEELEFFLEEPIRGNRVHYRNKFFWDVARPLWLANLARRGKDWHAAATHASACAAPDWRAAALDWLMRRQARAEGVTE